MPLCTCSSVIAPGCFPLAEPEIRHGRVPEEPGCSCKQVPDKFLCRKFMLFTRSGGVFLSWSWAELRECHTEKLWPNSPPHCYCVFVLAFLWGKVLVVGFFFFQSPRACPLSSTGTAGTLAESNSPGCFPYLCSISSSALAGKFKCSVMLTPWGLSLFTQWPTH